jgi:hypothetical protein
MLKTNCFVLGVFMMTCVKTMLPNGTQHYHMVTDLSVGEVTEEVTGSGPTFKLQTTNSTSTDLFNLHEVKQKISSALQLNLDSNALKQVPLLLLDADFTTTEGVQGVPLLSLDPKNDFLLAPPYFSLDGLVFGGSEGDPDFQDPKSTKYTDLVAAQMVTTKEDTTHYSTTKEVTDVILSGKGEIGTVILKFTYHGVP